ncbi:MAG: DUF2232 domain-containing protein [Holosporaceae bacterium]|jgi:hypothetical protein|nr:DUF2232 domain-containing protein [Holosporaceae bacterium]
MSPSNSFLKNYKELLVAVFFGVCAAFLFTPLLLLFAFFSYGEKIGTIASIIAATFIVFFYHEATASAILFFVVPAMVVGYGSLRNIREGKKIWWYPESFVLRDMIWTFVLSLILLSLTSYPEQLLDSFVHNMHLVIPNVNASDMQLLMALMTKSFFGIFVFSHMIGFVFYFLIADFVSRYLKKNIRPNFDMCNIAISPLLGVFPLVALVMASLWGGSSQIFYGLVAASLIAPLISGISLVHFFISNRNNSKIFLIIFYLMFFLMPVLIIFTILLGIIDAFHELRPLAKAK